ncbi:hypothetical protein BGZ88_004750 [Linnemannia elongata]|nr:hypothetical protein BGZ88_004750 [Linnemannia elongata]
MNLLFIERYSDYKPNLPIRLLTGCVNLESLTLFDQSCSQYARNEDYDAFQDILAAFPTRSLKKLSIEFELVFLSAYVHIDPSKLSLLARCPNLERLEIESPDECAVRYLTMAIRDFCPKLVKLVWGGRQDYQDELMDGLLTASRLGWRVLCLPYMDELEALIYDASGQRIDRDFFLDFFLAAKNLRRLTRCKHGERYINDSAVEIHAYDALMDQYDFDELDFTWALGSRMESLQMQIVGVPRPDVVC